MFWENVWSIYSHLCIYVFGFVWSATVLSRMNNGISLQAHFYVVCDTAGSPFLHFSSDGTLVKEVSRSPYGHITYDSNPSIKIPIGIFGGIQVQSQCNFVLSNEFHCVTDFKTHSNFNWFSYHQYGFCLSEGKFNNLKIIKFTIN